MDLKKAKEHFSFRQKIFRLKANTSSTLTLVPKNQNALGSILLRVPKVTMAHKWSLLVPLELISLHRKAQWLNLLRMPMAAFLYHQVQPSAILSGRCFIVKIAPFKRWICENLGKLPKLFPTNDRFSLFCYWIFVTWWPREHGSGCRIRSRCIKP